jgi:hypothetical protein
MPDRQPGVKVVNALPVFESSEVNPGFYLLSALFYLREATVVYSANRPIPPYGK